jgi:hypothetical protein
MRDANAILAEQVTKAERDRDAAVADSSAPAVRAGQFRDRHAALLEACDGAIDVLSPVGVTIEERLGNIPRWFREVVHHAVRRGATLALATAALRRGEDLHDMAIGFSPVERPDDVIALAMEFRGAAGAIAKYERVEDVIRSAPHDV